MEKKTIKSANGGVEAEALADLARQTSSAQALARQLAAVSAPAEALKDIVANRYSEIAKMPQTASEIARRIAGQDALSGLTGDPAAVLPKVDLRLPDISRTIQASLPKPLPDAYLPPSRENVTVPEIQVPRPETNVAAADAVEFKVTSPEDLGLLVRRARERRNLSQQRFADMAGVGRRFVSELENGKATLELGKVLKVVHAAGLSIHARER